MLCTDALDTQGSLQPGMAPCPSIPSHPGQLDVFGGTGEGRGDPSIIQASPGAGLLGRMERMSPASGDRSAAVLAAAQPPFTMCFRVKFYPTDPAALKEEITR